MEHRLQPSLADLARRLHHTSRLHLGRDSRSSPEVEPNIRRLEPQLLVSCRQGHQKLFPGAPTRGCEVSGDGSGCTRYQRDAGVFQGCFGDGFAYQLLRSGAGLLWQSYV
jgi:hypothetical protein